MKFPNVGVGFGVEGESQEHSTNILGIEWCCPEIKGPPLYPRYYRVGARNFGHLQMMHETERLLMIWKSPASGFDFTCTAVGFRVWWGETDRLEIRIGYGSDVGWLSRQAIPS